MLAPERTAGLLPLLVAVALSGCSGLRLGAAANPAAGSSPVTRPVPDADVPPEAARPIIAGYQGPPDGLHLSMYGNDALWVALPRDGVVQGIPQAGGLGDKFLTVRLIAGEVTAQGRRLDGPAPPATFSIPPGYGDSGFQAFGVTCPTPRCWQITQHLAGQALRFVVAVRPRPAVPAAAR